MRTMGLFAVLGVCALAACSDSKAGKSGVLTLVKLTEAFAGKDCDGGGQRVDAGRDTNGNAELDDDEITSTAYICTGSDGAKGMSAGAGPAGKSGKDGGLVAVNVSKEAPGAACPAGGQRIEIGADADADGKIDAGVTPDVTFVCDGEAGADGVAEHAVLVKTSSEPAGASCVNGGQKIQYGSDADGDGVLAAGEVQGTRYVCTGATGTTGAGPLTTATDEPAGANCVNGGKRVDSGQDTDHSGALEAGEVTSTKYVCNGKTGAAAKRSLVSVASEPAGANCATGGQKVTFGLDDNGDSTLAVGEIDGTKFVCNGAAANKDGMLALVSVSPEPPGDTCADGGSKIDVGLDLDANDTLDLAEITGTSRVCDFEGFENGSFELPAFAGWTVTSTNGQWLLVADGTTLTRGLSLFDYADQRDETLNSQGLPFTADATDGTTVAVQQQSSPGLHRLYQNFRVPSAATKLTWDMYYKNTNGSFNAATQYLAISVRKLSDDSVLKTLFKPTGADPLSTAGMQPFSVDITEFAGQAIRLDVEMNIQINWFDLELDNFVIQ